MINDDNWVDDTMDLISKIFPKHIPTSLRDWQFLRLRLEDMETAYKKLKRQLEEIDASTTVTNCR